MGSSNAKNYIIGNYSTIGGGPNYRVALRPVVGDGMSNVADGQDVSISSGNGNSVSANYSTVGRGILTFECIKRVLKLRN